MIFSRSSSEPPSLSSADLERLFNVTRTMTSTLDLPELLHTMMTVIKEFFRSEGCSILLHDNQTEELYFHTAVGQKGQALQDTRLRKGQGIAGWVAEQKKPALVNDVNNDPRWASFTDKKSAFNTQSILAVPMLVKDRLIGVMEVINSGNSNGFQENDLKLLELFAAQAAVSIDNARLFESVRQEQSKMNTILQEMKEGVLLFSPTGVLQLANPTAKNLFAIAKELPVPWDELMKDFETDPLWSRVQQDAKACPMMLKRKTQPLLWLGGIANPLRDSQGALQGFLLVVRDMTNEKREDLLKQNFLALVSHKLRTPLVAIRGFAPLLLERPEELSSFQQQAVRTIDRNSQELASLVDKLLHFATLESEKIELIKEPHLLYKIVEEVLRDLDVILKTQNVKVITDSTLQRLPPVLIDAERMKEVLRNLIENAVKFNPHLEREVTITGRTDMSWVQVSITDNGRGIPAEKMDKLFQMFYQVEEIFTGQVKGMGLGLALVKRLITEHGGKVRVESTLNQGTTFTISLPATVSPS